MVSELDVIPIEPAARDLGEAVEVRDVITVAVRLVRALNRMISMGYSRSEESSQEIADDTTNAMYSENVERVIDP